MGGELHSRLLGHGNDIFEKSLQSPPEFFMGNRGQVAGGCVAVVHHIPDRPIRDRHLFDGTVHPHGDGIAAPAEGRSHGPHTPRQTEVVTEYRDAGFAKPANDALHLLDLLRTLGTIEQNIVPVRRVDILNRGEDQPRFLNLRAKGPEFLYRPKFIRDFLPNPQGSYFEPVGLIVARVAKGPG